MADIKIDLSGIDLSGVEGAVTIQVNCGTCGGPMALQFLDLSRDAPLQDSSYTCPWCDTVESRYRMSGRTIWVTRYHEPERPKGH